MTLEYCKTARDQPLNRLESFGLILPALQEQNLLLKEFKRHKLNTFRRRDLQTIRAVALPKASDALLGPELLQLDDHGRLRKVCGVWW